MVNPVSTLLSGLQAQGVRFANTAQNIAAADAADYRAVATQIQSAGPDGGVIARTVPLTDGQGVSLDGELITGIQATQAYQAAAAALSRVTDMQDALLNAIDQRA